MRAWVSCGLYTPVATAEELVPCLQGFSCTLIIFLIIQETSLDGGDLYKYYVDPPTPNIFYFHFFMYIPNPLSFNQLINPRLLAEQLGASHLPSMNFEMKSTHRMVLFFWTCSCGIFFLPLALRSSLLISSGWAFLFVGYTRWWSSRPQREACLVAKLAHPG